jgi:ribonucleotide monophosphatase NagD (HAD superfamily)
MDHSAIRIGGVLLDIVGVIYVGDWPLPGALEAIHQPLWGE